MVKAVIDSNILMDLMNGVPEAATEISYYSQSYISVITWTEVMVGCIPANQVHQFQAFLAGANINVVQTDPAIAFRAAQIRVSGLAQKPRRQIELPDAYIGATAQTLNLMVVTRNSRDFGANTVRIPCQINAAGAVSNVLPPPP